MNLAQPLLRGRCVIRIHLISYTSRRSAHLRGAAHKSAVKLRLKVAGAANISFKHLREQDVKSRVSVNRVKKSLAVRRKPQAQTRIRNNAETSRKSRGRSLRESYLQVLAQFTAETNRSEMVTFLEFFVKLPRKHTLLFIVYTFGVAS